MEVQVERKAVMRYSEAFKLQVVRELEQGRLENAGKAGCACGVRGTHTVAAAVSRLAKSGEAPRWDAENPRTAS